MRPGRGGAIALENDEPLMEPVLVDGCLILCLGDETLELAPFEKYENRVFRKVDFSGVLRIEYFVKSTSQVSR